MVHEDDPWPLISVLICGFQIFCEPLQHLRRESGVLRVKIEIERNPMNQLSVIAVVVVVRVFPERGSDSIDEIAVVIRRFMVSWDDLGENSTLFQDFER